MNIPIMVDDQTEEEKRLIDWLSTKNGKLKRNPIVRNLGLGPIINHWKPSLVCNPFQETHKLKLNDYAKREITLMNWMRLTNWRPFGELWLSFPYRLVICAWFLSLFWWATDENRSKPTSLLIYLYTSLSLFFSFFNKNPLHISRNFIKPF